MKEKCPMKWQQCSVLLSVLAKPVEAEEREDLVWSGHRGQSGSWSAGPHIVRRVAGGWSAQCISVLPAREAAWASMGQSEDGNSLSWPMRSLTDRRARCWSEHRAWGAGAWRDGRGWVGEAETKHSVPRHTSNMSHWVRRTDHTVMTWHGHVSYVLP